MDKKIKINFNKKIKCFLIGDWITRAVALGAGFYHGYCDSQGIPLPKNMESLLTFTPAIVQGIYGAYAQSNIIFDFFKENAEQIVNSSYKNPANAEKLEYIAWTRGISLEDLQKQEIKKIPSRGAIAGGILTLVGYGAGRFVGNITK